MIVRKSLKQIHSYVCGVSWRQLIKWQNSFNSKASIALPVLAFAIAAFPERASSLLATNWRTHFIFWGALLFLLGQFIIFLRRPIEFTGELDTKKAISDIKNMMNFTGFKNRLDLFEKLIERLETKPPPGLNSVKLLVAKKRLEDAKTTTELCWMRHLHLIETSLRGLRDYDNPKGRIFSVMLISLGVLLMIFPTVWNIMESASKLIWVYLGFFLGWPN